MTARALSFRSFAQERPPVGGYLYHGSPRRHLRLNERRLAREPFFATDRREVALFFGADGGRNAGTIHYVKAVGPFWTLVEDDVSDEIGRFTSYIFARRGSVRIVPLFEVYRDYVQERTSSDETEPIMPRPERQLDWGTYTELLLEAAG